MKELNKLLKYRSYYEYDFNSESICVANGELYDEAQKLYSNIVSTYFFDRDEKWAFDIALDCIRNFTEEDLGTLVNRRGIFNYHSGYGMYVRNHYVHQNRLHLCWMPDNVSARVEELIYAMVLSD